MQVAAQQATGPVERLQGTAPVVRPCPAGRQQVAALAEVVARLGPVLVAHRGEVARLRVRCDRLEDLDGTGEVAREQTELALPDRQRLDDVPREIRARDHPAVQLRRLRPPVLGVEHRGLRREAAEVLTLGEERRLPLLPAFGLGLVTSVAGREVPARRVALAGQLERVDRVVVGLVEPVEALVEQVLGAVVGVEERGDREHRLRRVVARPDGRQVRLEDGGRLGDVSPLVAGGQGQHGLGVPAVELGDRVAPLGARLLRGSEASVRLVGPVGEAGPGEPGLEQAERLPGQVVVDVRERLPGPQAVDHDRLAQGVASPLLVGSVEDRLKLRLHIPSQPPVPTVARAGSVVKDGWTGATWPPVRGSVTASRRRPAHPAYRSVPR